MRRILLSMACLSAVFALSACGTKSKKSDETPAKPIYSGPTFSLVGINGTQWQSECKKVEKIENRSRKNTVSLEEHTFKLSSAFYDGIDCAENLIRVTFSDNFYGAKKEEVERLAGWTTVAFAVEAITLTLHREVLVMRYSENQTYGLSNWNLDQPSDISGRSFDAESEKELEKNVVQERTFKVENDVLYFARYAGNIPVATEEFAFQKK